MRSSGRTAARVWLLGLVLSALAAAALLYTTDVRALLRTAYLLEGLTRAEHKTRRLAGVGHYVARSRNEPTMKSPGAVTVDVYRPASLQGPLPAVLLMPGFNRLGLDDPYIANLSTLLAGLGVVVAVPDLRELYEFRWSGNVPRQIAYAFEQLASLPDVRQDRIGMIGLSISGGFGLAAAAQPSIAGRLSYAIAFAPFHSYERLVRFAATGCSGEHTSSPCDTQVSAFARGIVLYNFLHLAIPPAGPDLELARQALLAKLHGRDEDALAMTLQLSASSRTVLTRLEAGDLNLAVPLSEKAVSESRALASAMSPDANLCKLRGRLYLIHGEEDNVVPPNESDRLYEQCRRCGAMTCRILKTPLYSHGHTFARSLRKLPHYTTFYSFVREMSDDMLGISPVGP